MISTIRFTLVFLLLLFQTSCSHVFYYPDKNIYATPQKQNPPIEYEENIRIQSQDGTSLHAWLLKKSSQYKKPLGLVVYFHGNAQNITAHFKHLSWLTQAGYDVFIFDYRGFGLSDGTPNQEGIYWDALAALNYTWELSQNKKYPKYILYGQSLGGIILSRALVDFKHKDKVNLTVLDSTFLSYQKLARVKLSQGWLTWPLQWLAYLLISDDYASKDRIKELNAKTLVIHGTTDFVVPWKFGKEIYDSLESKNKIFWSLEEGQHIDVFYNPKYAPYYKKQFKKLISDSK